jgi:glutathione S-transferase
MAAHIVLEESGEKYQPQKVDLANGEQRTENYLKINPQGRVPVLRLDEGEPLAENTAILPYSNASACGRRNNWPTPRRLLTLFAASVHPAHAHRTARYYERPVGHPTLKEPAPRPSTATRWDDGWRVGTFSDQHRARSPWLVFYNFGRRRESPGGHKNYTWRSDRMVKRPAVGSVMATRRSSDRPRSPFCEHRCRLRCAPLATKGEGSTSSLPLAR